MQLPRNCPVCAQTGVFPLIEKTDSGAIHICPSCGLQFAVPLPPECPIFVDFSAAAAEQFAATDGGASLDSLFTPSERHALNWLKRTLRPGDTVLEICFEAGRLMEGIRRAGFRPYGCDPIAGHVSHLASRGFDVCPGLLDAIPTNWPEPKAIVMLESLVRFPDPVGVLTELRRRFPKASLFISVPSPNRSLKAPGFDRRSDYPPHHLHRWSTPSMGAALKAAGYSPQIKRAFIDANSLEVPHAVRILVRLAYRAIGEAEYSYFGIGTPC